MQKETENVLRIIYPHNQRLLLRRGNDVTVMKTCHALARRGHQVHLLIGRTHETDENILRYYGLDFHPNFHLVQLPILRRTSWPTVSWNGVYNYFCRKAILRIKKEKGADLLHLREQKLARFLFKHRNGIELPFVYEVHGLHAKDYAHPDPVEKDLLCRCDALITTTEILREKIKDLYDLSSLLFKVPLAADLPKAHPALTLPQPGEPWRLAYVGQLYPLQGMDSAVEALALLPESFVLDLIGGTEEQIENLRQQAKTLRVSNRITFHGFLPPSQVASRAAKAHIFLLPSLPRDKMPFVAHTKLYEYMAMGRPVVVANLPSVREEIRDGVNGLLFEAGCARSLARALLDLTSEPTRVLNMAQEAWQCAGDFSWERRAVRLEACFHKVLSERRRT